MDKRTADALEASIKHWQENVAAKTPELANVGANVCALCDMFNTEGTHDASLCHGCPVMATTGMAGCLGSPYHKARIALIQWLHGGYSFDYRNEFRQAAQAELDFLISLRDPAGADLDAPGCVSA